MVTLINAWERHIERRLSKLYFSLEAHKWGQNLSSTAVFPAQQHQKPAEKVRWFSLYWGLITLILLIAVGLTGVFLWVAPAELPMGDAYILLVYARNLAESGQFTFNPGLAEGVGATTLLWVLLLAGLKLAGVHLVLGAKVLGIGLYALTGVLVFDLIVRMLPESNIRRGLFIPFWGALLAILPGNFVWIALSGMETGLFMVLALLVLRYYYQERWLAVGIVGGLLTLTRLEGAVLVGAILVLEIWRHRRFKPCFWQILLPMAILVAPWILFLQIQGGAPVPTSFFGKQVSVVEARSIIGNWNALIAWAFQYPPIIYISSWLGYVTMYMTGIIALPGPKIAVAGPLGDSQFAFPWVGFGLLTLSLGFMVLLVLKMGWQRRKQITLDHPKQRFFMVIGLWLLFHNLLYAVILPIPGSAGRYGPMNQLLLWLILLAGIFMIQGRWWRRLATLFLITLVGTSIAYWLPVYQSNIRFMSQVRVPAARYVNEVLPAGAAVGADDLGALRFYGDHKVVDLFGFVNSEIHVYLANEQTYSEYIQEKNLKYLILFSSKTNSSMELTNPADQMGLLDNPNLEMVEIRTFAVPFDEWARGSAAVSNYFPSLTLFQLSWKEP